MATLRSQGGGGVLKETRDSKRVCVKQYCVENSDLGIDFNGDARSALKCCDDSAKRRIISKISEYLVHCTGKTMPNEIDRKWRDNPKADFPPNIRYKKKNDDSNSISY